MTIRVLIADDQAMIRAGFRYILEAAGGIEVVGEADTGREAIAKALHLRPDVCLFDIRMPDLDGLEATRQVAGTGVADTPRVVIVTTFDLDDYVFGALEAGAVGFLLKNAGPEMLIEAVKAANDGESLVSPAITTRLLRHVVRPSLGTEPNQPASGALTAREEEVLTAVAAGLTNAEIAERLHLSLSTAKAHVANLMNKIVARNRVELVIWAYQTGRMTTGSAES